jgi:hypothetical protein
MAHENITRTNLMEAFKSVTLRCEPHLRRASKGDGPDSAAVDPSRLALSRSHLMMTAHSSFRQTDAYCAWRNMKL